MDKPFAPSCERNQEFILKVLKEHVEHRKSLIEIGSGTGQHAAFMAPQLGIRWQTTDLKENHAGIRAWTDDAESISPPIEVDLSNPPAALENRYELVFTANTLHIVDWEYGQRLFELAQKWTTPDARIFIYGPFNYNGEFTSESNASFNEWLKDRGDHQGIRNFEDVTRKAEQSRFRLLKDVEMPANNRLLIFQRED